MKLGTKLVLGVGVALLVVGALIAGLLIGRGGSDSQSSPDGREGSAQNVDGGGAAQDRTPAPTPNLEAQFAAPTTDELGRVIEVPTNGMGVPLSTTAPGSRRPTDPDWLTAAPLGVRWQMTGGTPTALSTHDGPTHVDPTTGQTSGYSHTPQGAILAAQSIIWRLMGGDTPGNVRSQVVTNDLRSSEFMDAFFTHVDQLVREREWPLALAAPRGFKVAEYSESRAIVLFFDHTARPTTMPFFPTMVEWRDGQWVAVVGGHLTDEFKERHSSRAGMTRW